MLNAKESEKHKTEDEHRSIPYWQIFKQSSVQMFNVFLIFFVTLSVFPAVHSDIKPLDENFIIPPQYFTIITCFLTFNFFAMLGSLLTSWVQWVRNEETKLVATKDLTCIVPIYSRNPNIWYGQSLHDWCSSRYSCFVIICLEISKGLCQFWLLVTGVIGLSLS